MKKDFETRFTGWSFILAALFLLSGWQLLPHHIGEYFKSTDFEAVGENLWYWIWMFRIHLFGWVIMAGAMIAFMTLTYKSSSRILLIPGAGIVIAGSFILALAFAFYYTYGAWGVGMTAGKSVLEIQQFMDNIIVTNQYATCIVRFGRIFSGVGLLIFGIGLIKGKIVDSWLGLLTVLLGVAAMAIILFIPVNFEIYKPVFYVKVLWLFLFGLMLLLKGIDREN